MMSQELKKFLMDEIAKLAAEYKDTPGAFVVTG